MATNARNKVYLRGMGAVAGLAMLLGGCSSILIGLGLENPSGTIVRAAPAQLDLKGIKVIAIAPVEGHYEQATEVAAQLGSMLAEHGRFSIVEREQLMSVASERGCDLNDSNCLAGELPAAAIVFGTVTRGQYLETTRRDTYECTRDGRKTVCATVYRLGTAHFHATLRVVETGTGKVLHQALVRETTNAKTSGSDGSAPAPIDNVGLLAAAQARALQQFVDTISPHHVMEHVELLDDGDLPELSEGIELTQLGRHRDALARYQAAVARVRGAPVDPELEAAAHYDLAVGFAAVGDFESAKKSADEALRVQRLEAAAALRARLDAWQADAERSNAQLAMR